MPHQYWSDHGWRVNVIFSHDWDLFAIEFHCVSSGSSILIPQLGGSIVHHQMDQKKFMENPRHGWLELAKLWLFTPKCHADPPINAMSFQCLTEAKIQSSEGLVVFFFSQERPNGSLWQTSSAFGIGSWGASLLLPGNEIMTFWTYPGVVVFIGSLAIYGSSFGPVMANNQTV